MLTGRSPFGGETVSDTIVAILEREPDWHVLPDSTLPDVRRMLQRCLEKDPKRRLHDVADVRIEIEDAITTFASGRPTSSVAAGAQSRVARATIAVAPAGRADRRGHRRRHRGRQHRLARHPSERAPCDAFGNRANRRAALSLSNRGGDFAVTRDGSLIYRGRRNDRRATLDPRPRPARPPADCRPPRGT